MGKEMRGGGEEGGAGAGAGEEERNRWKGRRMRGGGGGGRARLSLFSYGFILVASARVRLLGLCRVRFLPLRGGGYDDEGKRGGGEEKNACVRSCLSDGQRR